MAIETTVVGSYPKPPDEGAPFRLRRALHARDRGEASDEDVRVAQDELVKEVVAEQEGAGVDIVTDGQVRWDDIVTPFAVNMSGFEIGGLMRFFDNNVYYRRPICTGPIEWRGPSSVDAFRFARSVAAAPVKAVIPGAVTLARLSEDDYYRDHARFVLAIARVLAQEAFELMAAGCAHIQVDEPSLLNAPEDLSLAKEALELVTAELRDTEVTLATYFEDAKRLGASLFDLPADVLALDFASGEENSSLVAEGRGKKIQAGVVDARNTRLEDPADLARTLSKLADEVGAEKLRAAPSCGLEFLPREKARAKLHLLVEAARGGDD